MKIKIIQAHTLEELEAEINTWVEENPKSRVLNGNVTYHGDWRCCYAVFWYREGTVKKEEG